MAYSELQSDKIESTARELALRVSERFPENGIARVGTALAELSTLHIAYAGKARDRNWLMQVISVLLVLAGLSAAGWGVWQLLELFGMDANELGSIQGLDSVLNIMIVTGAAIWFVLNLETRQRRARVLARLHELRALAHVIDMHQLRKDPTAYYRPPTAHSPNRDLSESNLMAYLDYCAEMLAIIGKLAALYMQNMNDAIVIDAANDIESLTGGFSQKIWLKISVLQPLAEAERCAADPSLNPLS
ncbi:hypothetical protein [Hyphomonas sp.]|uniref:hypothetical protein n=1 Tax=Hyphomonas sp. TaxID=87 RepID=UPI001BCE59F2|nr:hypothetical protein [Hyphomonas sp.]